MSERGVSIEPARARLFELAAAGWTVKQIAEVSGVSFPTLTRIRCRSLKSITVETADAVLGTHPYMRGRARPDMFVPSHGVRRRLQALATMGWSQHALAARLNTGQRQIFLWVHSERDVLRATHDRISALYRALIDTPPTPRTSVERAAVTRTKREAAARGYFSPMHWDNIDDPNEVPEPEPVRTAANIESIDDTITVLHADGWFDDRIALHVGLHTRQVGRIRERLGLPSNRHRNAA